MPNNIQTLLNKEQLTAVIEVISGKVEELKSIDSLSLSWNPIRNWTELIATKKAYKKTKEILDEFLEMDVSDPEVKDERDEFY